MNAFTDFFNDFKDVWHSFYTSLEPLKTPPSASFWKLCREDFNCIVVMYFTTFLIWASATKFKDPWAVVKCWDSPNYIFVAITMSNCDGFDNPWTKIFQYPDYYLACHLPGYPLIIKFCSFFTFGNYVVAAHLSILFCDFLMVYAFRRMLIIYNCSQNPTLLTMLLSFIPSRLVVYHSLPASEPCFLSCIFFAFIFYKIGNYHMMMLSIWYCCITRIEGMAVGAAFGVCFLLLFDIPHAAMMFLTFVPDICLLIMHKMIYGEWMAYFLFNQKNQGIIQWPPMYKLNYFSKQEDHVDTYSFVAFYVLLSVAWILLIPNHGPASILSFIFLIYITLLFHIDIYRYGLPGSVFCFLIGFDKLLTSPNTINAIKLIFIPYLILITIYASGQINSNTCMDYFMEEVLKPTKRFD